MARLYANENFPFPVVVALRKLGHDVLTSQDAGNAGRAVPDEEVLKFAIAQGRILLTINRKHFIKLHRVSAKHAGIIVCTYDPDFVGQANRIAVFLQTHAPLDNELIRINRPV
ncbi:DUF5615 family PIN-like protein [Candidatus Viridilinea mediisalina]|uniref:DUF5615 domain-containing protein n=1 Tax=Candidatus Viridilinea mediisalina TaxID=2024553 RepID=A0A2A6RMG7_9CHLR|nr:DUF5615 family PIN-like protein [Candidatus Viridilinea mediisalina]PDW04049.1 hypothetical protein CJ255_05615 [Candidatus Viridilinea mediisalina]